MAKKIKLSEEGLTRIIKNILEEELGADETILSFDDVQDLDNETEENGENALEDIEDELEQILSPEEILGLMDEQIGQLQSRVQYMEELNADVLEFISYQMQDLERTDIGAELKKSKQKLRALETRAGREIFWLKSRRL